MDKKDQNDYRQIIENDILKLLDLDGVSDEKKDELYQKMLSTIQNRVVARLLDELDEKSREKFKKLLDGEKEEEIKKMLANKGININELMAQEALIYKTEVVGLVEDNNLK